MFIKRILQSNIEIKRKNISMNLSNLILMILIFIYYIIQNWKLLFNFQLLEQNNHNTDNYYLVFIKPENLSKTELVEKFKELSSSKSLNELKNIKNEDIKIEDKKDKLTIKELLKSYYLKISAFILKYNNLITKIALFTILIKYLRKIRIMKVLFRIINYFFLTTFGIFITDIYGLKEIILQIEYYWIEYVNFIHENKIYKTLIKIFNVVSDENKSEVIEDKIVVNKSEVIEDKIVVNKSESKIIKSDFPSSGRELKNEKIMIDKTSEGNTKEYWIEINKYFWIGLSIISVSLIYIYWDSIIELFKNVKPNDDDGSSTSENSIFLSNEEKYKEYFKELSTNDELYDLEQIRTQQKGEPINYSEVENTKWGDSPTTPKASTSKLPESQRIMLPISKK